MPQPHRFQRLADERDVVGRAAATARLRDDDRKLVRVVFTRHDRFHDLARDQDGRIADIVVHILETRVHCPMIDRR